MLAEVNGWWVSLLPVALQALGVLALAAVGLLVLYLKKKLKLSDAQAQALDAIADAVNYTQEAFVAEAKAAAEDGKLTEQEIAIARAMAKKKALDIANGPALKFLQSLAQESWSRLINQIVEKMKLKE